MPNDRIALNGGPDRAGPDPALLRFCEQTELPTWGLIVLVYGGWLGLTYWWAQIPIWIGAPLAAWTCAWHMSLQHEIIHGHPTSRRWLNDAIGAPPLSLWLPYDIYKSSHLVHHRDAFLTDPFEDPETTYMDPGRWARTGPVGRWIHQACNTLAGRMLLGPARAISLLWLHELRSLLAGRLHWRCWLVHFAGVAVVLWWVCGVCRMPFGVYFLCFSYAGASLAMIRSLAEHKAAPDAGDRSAVVENAGLFAVLFLNLNLHVLHHAKPGIPWYMLPQRWRQAREEMIRGRSFPIYRGYAEIASRYLLRPHHPGPHPFPETTRAGARPV